MLWILVAWLLILSLLLVQFLKTFIAKVKDSYFVYPGNAVIDQALPQEIMEHMMTFLDARAMIECRLVSKYWRHHAIKPNIEAEVITRARGRLREVYDELIGSGVSIDSQIIEELMNSPFTQDKFFLRASALASKYGGDLIVAGNGLFHHITRSYSWPSSRERKRYFALTSTYKFDDPWQFSLANQAVTTRPVFDVSQIEWHDAPTYSTVDVMVDANDFPNCVGLGVNLYLYRVFNAARHFYFVPLNNRMFPVLTLLFSPMIVHDALHSNYLSTIKSWFGPIMFICAAVAQLILLYSITNHHAANTEFKITLSVFSMIYMAATYAAYPASMNVFASMGILALMVGYSIVGGEYIQPYYHKPLTKKKKQILIIAALLIFLMIDWKLVVMSMADLTFFRTLFDNTVAYALILLLFIFYNFLAQVNDYGFHLRLLFYWNGPAVRFLRNSYLLVILMTLIAPTWRGNYL